MGGERNIVQFLANLLFHSGGQNSSCVLRPGRRESRVHQYLGRAGKEVELTVRADIEAGTISLHAAIKEDEELGGIVENNLTRERHSSGEEDLVDCGVESVLSRDKMKLIEHWRS